MKRRNQGPEDKRVRRVLYENPKKVNKNDIDNDEDLEFNTNASNPYDPRGLEEDPHFAYTDDYYQEVEPKPRKKKVLFTLTLALSLIFVIFILLNSLFYIRTRIIVFITILLLILIYYYYEFKKRRGFGKVLVKLMMILNSLAIIVFIPFYIYTDISLKATNREEVDSDPGVYPAQSYNVLILGLDTEGSIEEISRSDVNILTTVNMKEDKILLSNIPRDSYLPIALGGQDQYDKLTHAGNYGVESSMKTIENALDTPVEYYFKINFTSFVNVIDVIGGVDVYNDYEFTARNGTLFPQGEIHLDGSQALTFVRERYALRDGDLGRGSNQQKVIKAVLEKLASPRTLFNYPSIIEVVKESIATNLATNEIFNTLVEYVLSRGFDMERTELGGYGASGLPSYAMPDYNLYMYVPYEESINELSNQINNLLKE